MRVRRYTYPHYWKQIARALRAIRGMKCEQCGAPHGVLICRELMNPAKWVEYQEGQFGHVAELIYNIPVKNVVSIHHIGIDRADGTPGSSLDKMDCRPKNLIGLCARCHLLADLPVSKLHARETKYQIKRQRIRSIGQIEMFSE